MAETIAKAKDSKQLSDFADVQVEVFGITNKLRFIKRRVRGEAKKQMVLQQMLRGNKGNIVWEDVPVEDDPKDPNIH